MKYITLLLGILAVAWGVWMINGRADEMAQSTISACNNLYEATERNSQLYQVDNSENIQANVSCQGQAYQDADARKNYGIAAILAGGIFSLISFTKIKNQRPALEVNR